MTAVYKAFVNKQHIEWRNIKTKDGTLVREDDGRVREGATRIPRYWPQVSQWQSWFCSAPGQTRLPVVSPVRTRKGQSWPGQDSELQGSLESASGLGKLGQGGWAEGYVQKLSLSSADGSESVDACGEIQVRKGRWSSRQGCVKRQRVDMSVDHREYFKAQNICTFYWASSSQADSHWSVLITSSKSY